jgi:hypothetical protein
MMTTLIYDGTFEGLLTAVFEVYDRRLDRVNLQKTDLGADALFEDKLQVITDEARANRVLKGLKQKISSMGCSAFMPHTWPKWTAMPIVCWATSGMLLIRLLILRMIMVTGLYCGIRNGADG